MFRIRPLLNHEVIHSHFLDDDTLGILRCQLLSQHLESGSELEEFDSEKKVWLIRIYNVQVYLEFLRLL